MKEYPTLFIFLIISIDRNIIFIYDLSSHTNILNMNYPLLVTFNQPQLCIPLR